MIKYGENNIGRVILGGNEIGKAYLGSNLVFSMDNPPAPSGHFLDYLTFTRGSWFNTGIKSAKSLTLDVTFMPTTTAANWLTLLGCRNSNSRDYIVSFGTDSDVYSVIYLGLNSGSGARSVTSSSLFPIIDNKIRLIKDSSTGATFYKNGTQTNTETFQSSTTISSQDIYVGGFNRYDLDARYEYFIGRIYELRLGSVTFLPYRYGSVYGMLRMDNNVFYPSVGSDAFGGSSTGPDTRISKYSYSGGQLDAFVSYAPITSGTSTVISEMNNRITFGKNSGDTPLLDTNGQPSSYYPLPVPSTAKYVHYKITPSSMYCLIRCIALNNGVYTTVSTNPFAQAEGFISIPNGCTHITINTKYNEAGDSYPSGYPNDIQIEFYT